MSGKKEIHQHVWFFHGALQLVITVNVQKRCYFFVYTD